MCAERRGGDTFRKEVLPPFEVRLSSLWMGGWGREEALSSWAPNLASAQCLTLGMVSLGLSVVICFTTTAFLPPAALPCVSLALTAFFGLLVPHHHTSTFLSGPSAPSALSKFWFAHTPIPHCKLLTSHSLLSHPFAGSLKCISPLHFANPNTFLWQSFEYFLSCLPSLYLPMPCRYIIFCFWTYSAIKIMKIMVFSLTLSSSLYSFSDSCSTVQNSLVPCPLHQLKRVLPWHLPLFFPHIWSSVLSVTFLLSNGLLDLGDQTIAFLVFI